MRLMRGPSPALFGLLVASGLAGAAPPASPPTAASAIPPAAPLVPSPEARDPLLALLVGIVDQDRRGVFDRHRLESELRRTGRTTRIPLDRVASVSRGAGPGGTSMIVSLVLAPKGDIPIPYDILGYHPGKLRFSRRVEMEEWRLGTVRFSVPGETRPVELEDVVLLGLRTGSMELDVDGWLDALLGPKLDDTIITGIVLFRNQGERVSMAVGYSRTGHGQSGVFSLSQDEIVFPRPEKYRVAGRVLRDRLEHLAPETLRFARTDPHSRGD